MTKVELIKQVAIVARITLAEAERAVNAMEQAIQFTLRDKGRIVIQQVGTLKKAARKACYRGNPQKPGEKVLVPAHNTVSFRPAPSLKEAVN